MQAATAAGILAASNIAWGAASTVKSSDAYRMVAATDREHILRSASEYLSHLSVTITSFRSPYRKDVEHFDALPVRSPGLLFAGLACGQVEYIVLWKTLNPDPTDREIIRNYPLR